MRTQRLQTTFATAKDIRVLVARATPAPVVPHITDQAGPLTPVLAVRATPVPEDLSMQAPAVPRTVAQAARVTMALVVLLTPVRVVLLIRVREARATPVLEDLVIRVLGERERGAPQFADSVLTRPCSMDECLALGLPGRGEVRDVLHRGAVGPELQPASWSPSNRLSAQPPRPSPIARQRNNTRCHRRRHSASGSRRGFWAYLVSLRR